MHLSLICRPNAEPYGTPENAGYDYQRVVDALERRLAGGDSYEVTDTSGWSDDERDRLYIDGAVAAVAAAGNRYRVGRVFGSNRHPGDDFGASVPALLIYADRGDTYPTDVYP